MKLITKIVLLLGISLFLVGCNEIQSEKEISSIALTKTEGLVDTYTITYTDGTTSTFTLTNGEDGKSAYQTYIENNPLYTKTESELKI
mgnify:CR=1 FL=1